MPLGSQPDEARSRSSGGASGGASRSADRGASRTAPPNPPPPAPNSPAQAANGGTGRGPERPWRVSPAGTGRPWRTDAVLGLQARLTDRDETLLGWLADHHVLTTPQITRALFGSTGFAQRRLLTLHRDGLIDRFRPLRPGGGAYPWHYVLAHLGALHVAAVRDQSPPRPAATTDRIRRIATSRTLDHRLGVNGFFTDLAGHARTHPGTRLERWWSEAQCAAPGAFAPGLISPIRPDGHGIWTETGDDGRPRTPGVLPRIRHRHRGPPRLVGQAGQILRPRRPWRFCLARPVRRALTSPRGAPPGEPSRRLRRPDRYGDHGTPERFRPGPSGVDGPWIGSPTEIVDRPGQVTYRPLGSASAGRRARSRSSRACRVGAHRHHWPTA